MGPKLGPSAQPKTAMRRIARSLKIRSACSPSGPSWCPLQEVETRSSIRNRPGGRNRGEDTQPLELLHGKMPLRPPSPMSASPERPTTLYYFPAQISLSPLGAAPTCTPRGPLAIWRTSDFRGSDHHNAEMPLTTSTAPAACTPSPVQANPYSGAHVRPLSPPLATRPARSPNRRIQYAKPEFFAPRLVARVLDEKPRRARLGPQPRSQGRQPRANS